MVRAYSDIGPSESECFYIFRSTVVPSHNFDASLRNMPQMVPVHRQLGPQIVGQALQQITEVSEPVKVFVGNISEKAGDTLVRQILMKCGSVANWRRTSGGI